MDRFPPEIGEKSGIYCGDSSQRSQCDVGRCAPTRGAASITEQGFVGAPRVGAHIVIQCRTTMVMMFMMIVAEHCGAMREQRRGLQAPTRGAPTNNDDAVHDDRCGAMSGNAGRYGALQEQRRALQGTAHCGRAAGAADIVGAAGTHERCPDDHGIGVVWQWGHGSNAGVASIAGRCEHGERCRALPPTQSIAGTPGGCPYKRRQ